MRSCADMCEYGRDTANCLPEAASSFCFEPAAEGNGEGQTGVGRLAEKQGRRTVRACAQDYAEGEEAVACIRTENARLRTEIRDTVATLASKGERKRKMKKKRKKGGKWRRTVENGSPVSRLLSTKCQRPGGGGFRLVLTCCDACTDRCGMTTHPSADLPLLLLHGRPGLPR